MATVSRTGEAPRLTVTLDVDPHGRISGVLFKPLARATPTTWRAIDGAVHSVAPKVRMLVASITGGRCQALHSLDAGTTAPLGSTFKLYVLYALGQAIASHRISWNQPLTIASKLKSLPRECSRTSPTEPGLGPGGREQAHLDQHNTAADIPIHQLGQRATRDRAHLQRDGRSSARSAVPHPRGDVDPEARAVADACAAVSGRRPTPAPGPARHHRRQASPLPGGCHLLGQAA